MKTRDEILPLIEAYCNGVLDDAGFAALSEALRNDAGTRALLRRYMNLDAALHDLVPIDGELAAWDDRPRVAEARKARITAPLLAAAAALVFLLGIAAVMLRQGTIAAGNGPEATAEGYAVLTQLVDAKWAEGAEPMRKGDSLAAGHIRLESGLAQIEFFCGATVILEGGADLEIRSSWEAYCHKGKLRANVPPAARGFTIKTSDMDVIDLGTEFGLEVDGGGKAQVHVFDGKVKLQSGGGETRELAEGEGLGVDGDGARRTMNADPAGFHNLRDLEAKSVTGREARYLEWQAYSQGLRQDARLIAYYPMDGTGTGSRKVVNEARDGNTERDGAMVGVLRVPGRFGAPKSAMEFRKPGDRVRVFIPGEYGSLTLACWVKLDSIDRDWNSLYLTDGYEPGEVHWQITHERKLTYSMKVGEKGQNYLYQSPPFWDESMAGKWMHLATVFDVERAGVIHYVNGAEVSRERVAAERMVATTRFGAGEIGNWGLSIYKTDPEFVVRSLNGLMDEFALFSAALSGDEIRDMFEKGRP